MSRPVDPPASIIFLSHPRHRQQIPLRKAQFFIGRDSNNDLCVSEDNAVSRLHCVLSVEEAPLTITDCDSTNGTYLNGIRIKGTVTLPLPSLVAIGRSRFAVVAPGSPGSNLSTVLQSTYSSRGSIVIPSTLREIVSAFLVVDLVSSTRILRKDAYRLASIVATLGIIMERHLSREIEPFLQCTGDGFFAAFSKADTAMSVADGLQSSLHKHLSEPTQLSLALHWGKSYLTGEGSRTGGDVYAVFALENLRHQHKGICVSLQSSCSKPLVLMTGPFYAKLDRENQRRTSHLGQFRLRGIDHPVEVYQRREM
jgi:class 3 adenylate cyclase